jgi:hypothetical protein
MRWRLFTQRGKQLSHPNHNRLQPRLGRYVRFGSPAISLSTSMNAVLSSSSKPCCARLAA